MTYKAATTEFICQVFKSVYSLVNSPVNMALPAFAAERRAAAPAAVDRYVLRAERSAAKPPPHAAAAVERWDRQTDRQTDARPLHKSCFA